jgi:hypothetical protein
VDLCVQGREKRGGEYADMILIPSSGCIHIQRGLPRRRQIVLSGFGG